MTGGRGAALEVSSDTFQHQMGRKTMMLDNSLRIPFHNFNCSRSVRRYVDTPSCDSLDEARDRYKEYLLTDPTLSIAL
jgi:hypothetical protein